MAKLAKKRNKPQITGADTVVSFMEYFVTIMCMAIVALVPLYMKNAFFEIGQCKYDIYYGITIVGLSILLVFAIVYFVLNRKNLLIQVLKMNLSITDIIVIAYLVFAILSFVFSNYKDKAWSGYAGWNMGLYAQISFVLLYFFVSRLVKDYKAILTVLMAASTLVILFGILNRFLIDPLGVYEGIAEHYYVQFLSTLGQSSWYSSFLCVVLPIGVFAFWNSEKKSSLIITGIYVVLGFMSLVTQNSDSAYFALVGMMLVLFGFSVEEWKKTQKFFAIIFLFALAAKIVKLICMFANISVIVQLDIFSLYLINGILSWVIMGVSFLFIAFFVFGEKVRAYPVKVMKIIRAIIYIVFGVGLSVAIILLIFSEKADANSLWAGIPYLYWHDNWGNGRGFTWRVSWQMLKEMSLTNKLFGVGPECYPYYGNEFYKELIQSKWGNNVLTNAHNEWLNAVVNYGLLGGISYLGIFISSIVSCGRKAKQMPELIMIMVCVVAYMSHNLFCYQQVLCTPFIIIIMAIGQYLIKKGK